MTPRPGAITAAAVILLVLGVASAVSTVVTLALAIGGTGRTVVLVALGVATGVLAFFEVRTGLRLIRDPASGLDAGEIIALVLLAPAAVSGFLTLLLNYEKYDGAVLAWLLGTLWALVFAVIVAVAQGVVPGLLLFLLVAGEKKLGMVERVSFIRRSTTKEGLLFVAFVAPAATVFYGFFFYPLGRLIHFSLYQQNRTGTAERYIGTKQITEVLSGDEFREGLMHTVSYVLYTVPVGLVLGIALAVVANRALKGIKIFQTIFASTVATSVAVASVIFFVLLNPQVGYFKVNWLADPDMALFGVSISSIWQNLGLTFIIVLAGLQAVPDELMESATIDGAGPLRRFFRVTLPIISPTLLFLVVVLTVFAFQAFAQIDILTAGGPAGSTETLVFKIFQRQQPIDLGEGSVMALGLFGITFLVTMGQFLILDRRVHYG